MPRREANERHGHLVGVDVGGTLTGPSACVEDGGPADHEGGAGHQDPIARDRAGSASVESEGIRTRRQAGGPGR